MDIVITTEDIGLTPYRAGDELIVTAVEFDRYDGHPYYETVYPQYLPKSTWQPMWMVRENQITLASVPAVRWRLAVLTKYGETHVFISDSRDGVVRDATRDLLDLIDTPFKVFGPHPTYPFLEPANVHVHYNVKEYAHDHRY